MHCIHFFPSVREPPGSLPQIPAPQPCSSRSLSVVPTPDFPSRGAPTPWSDELRSHLQPCFLILPSILRPSLNLKAFPSLPWWEMVYSSLQQEFLNQKGYSFYFKFLDYLAPEVKCLALYLTVNRFLDVSSTDIFSSSWNHGPSHISSALSHPLVYHVHRPQ